MKQEIDRNEWIDAYLKGELPVDEASKIEERIASDANFASEVESIKELREIVMDSSLIHVKEELSSIHSYKLRTKWIKKITGYGSGAIVIGLVIFYILTGKPVQKEKQIVTASDTAIVVNSINKVLTDTAKIFKDNKILVHPPKINKHEIVNDEQIIPENTAFTNDTSLKKAGLPLRKQDEPVKEEQTPAVKPSPKLPDCSKVRIRVALTSEESCNTSSTGSITVIRETVKGGKKPYSFSLNKADFSDSGIFRNLASNIYSVYVKDANNCVVKGASILVGRKDCSVTYQEIFAPLKGEIWEMPVKQGGEGKILIFTKNGNMVYSANVSPNSENTWKGENTSGQVLPMGVYQFIIKYTDGEVFAGNVTIKK